MGQRVDSAGPYGWAVAAAGDTDRVTQVVEQWPLTCPNGHPFSPSNPPSVGWVPCGCQHREPRGHRTYWCLVCDAALYQPACTNLGRR